MTHERIIAVGFRRWKARNLRPLLDACASSVRFVEDCAAAAALRPGARDALGFWGAIPPPGLRELATQTGAALLHIEDGFIRSVGLGSDLIPPQSLVLDRTGTYFDATRPSDLETLLQTTAFEPDLLHRAAAARAFIVENGLTKYNIEPRHPPRWRGAAGARHVVLVPGQVETDASIALGGADIRSNMALLSAVRRACPDAFIVYKPHPDVLSRNRRGRVARAQAATIADVIETDASIVSCIEACNAVHTITSLSGFDALLRGKHVVTYGAPFYAGWGLTEDRAAQSPAWARRTRKLTLDELVAGALLLYPAYWQITTKRIVECELVLFAIAQERDLLEGNGQLEHMRSGLLRRQLRKLHSIWLALHGDRKA